MPSFFFLEWGLDMNLLPILEIIFVLIMISINAFAMYHNLMCVTLICTGMLGLYIWLKAYGYL